MLVTIDRDHLRDGLKTVGGAVATRTHLPVLGMVLLTADEKGLRFSGTNLEMAMTTVCAGCTVEEPGTLAIPLKDLADLAAKLPAGAVRLSTTPPAEPIALEPEPTGAASPDPAEAGQAETESDPIQAESEPVGDDLPDTEPLAETEPAQPAPRPPLPPDTLYISAGDVEGTLVGLPHTEFPTVSFTPTDQTVVASWAGPNFVRHVEAVSFAASTDTSRPVLQGILFQVLDDGCRMVTADGFRLAALGQPCKPQQRPFAPPRLLNAVNDSNGGNGNSPTEVANPWPQVLLPAHAIDTFTRVVGDTPVGLFRGGTPDVWLLATGKAGETVLLVREIEMNFPDYAQIIPTPPPALTVTVSKRALTERLNVSVLYARRSALLVRLEITGDTLTLLANAEMGNSDVAVPILSHVGEGTAIAWPFTIGINGRYLAEAIRAAASMSPDGDTVQMSFWSDTRPMTVAPCLDNAKDGETPVPLTIVQMPMHITR